VRDDRAVRIRLFSLKALIFGCFVAMMALPSVGQSAEADIAARLIGKPLYLRGLWAYDDLKFDVDGKPLGGYAAEPFTEAGIDVTAVKLQSDGLRIEGQRMALEFQRNGTMMRAPFKAKHYKGHITVEVKAAPGTDFGKALDAVFAPDLWSLIPSLPIYWQSYAQKNFLAEEAGSPETEADIARSSARETIESTADRPLHIGGSLLPPKVLKSVEPRFTDAARALKFSGNVQVYLWVAEDGSVSHVRISKPAGLGLDEAAVAAVQQYTFTPATLNGKAVKVDLYIDVNFQIF
jgi:TonB family protein